MQYVHLTNDSYVIHTSNGTFILTRESFNFNKVKRLLSNNAEEEKILPLLKPPVLKDGIYKAYIVPSLSKMYYAHFKETGNNDLAIEYKELNGTSAQIPETHKLVGVYASKEELILDWPEYTI